MADMPARTELRVTTGPIRGSRKVHVGPLRVAMREIDLEGGSLKPRRRFLGIEHLLDEVRGRG